MTNFESDVDQLRRWREAKEYTQFRAGLRLARMDRTYGAGTIPRAANEAGFARTTGYEYVAVVEFLVAWLGLSARRIQDLYPDLSYTHLRDSLSLPYEDRIDALMAVSVGDERFPQFDENLPMTPEAFRVYKGLLLGEDVPDKPLFDMSGWAHEMVVTTLYQLRRLSGKVRVIIKSID